MSNNLINPPLFFLPPTATIFLHNGFQAMTLVLDSDLNCFYVYGNFEVRMSQISIPAFLLPLQAARLFPSKETFRSWTKPI